MKYLVVHKENKPQNFLTVEYWPNRLLKFFWWQIQCCLCSKLIIKDPITPQTLATLPCKILQFRNLH